MTQFYAGIGSRKTPEDICCHMAMAATQLAEHGFILRSGAAPGADAAFERGVFDDSMKQIFLPWPRYNKHPSPYSDPLDEAHSIAQHFHPAWSSLTQGVQKLMARNVHQILGPSLNEPVSFVICWTPNGSGSGGTGQAIRIAQASHIPVFDLGAMPLEEAAQRINSIID